MNILRRKYIVKYDESVFTLSLFTYICASLWHIGNVKFRCIGSYVR